MPFVVTCRACGSRFQAPDHVAGKRGKCPKCSTLLDLVATAPAAQSQPAAADAALTAGERLAACPDCGKMVSRRAQQCPHCGCPIYEAAAAAVASPRAAATLGDASAEVAEQSSRKLLLAAAGGAVALCVVVGVVIVIVKAMSNPPAPPAVAQPAPPPSPKVSAEQKEAWIKEVADARAKDVDSLYREMHSAGQLLDSAQQTADLLTTMAKTGDFPKPSAEAPAKTPQPKAYPSQYDALFQECCQYLRGNLPSGDYSRDNVLEAGSRWAKQKEAPVHAQLEQLMQRQATLQGGAPPAAQPAEPPTTPPTPAAPQ